jgi:hypothetical protein
MPEAISFFFYVTYFLNIYDFLFYQTPGLAEKQFRVFEKIGNLKYSGNK